MMNSNKLLFISLLFATSAVVGVRADHDDDGAWGLCYFDAECKFACGDALVAEDCLAYQQGGPPGSNIPPIDVPYFMGPDGVCQQTESQPELIGKCCNICGDENNECTGYYNNPDGCVAQGYKYFYDRIGAYQAQSDESDAKFCYEVDGGGNKVGSTSGDPHFKTWTGDKFDYHGECDLVLIDNPTFMNGLGLRLHIRTTRVGYYSYMERIALQVGTEVLEFANDLEKFYINGKMVEPNRRYHKTLLSGFLVRRGGKKAISVRLSKENYKRGSPRIDFVARKVGFPAVVVNSGGSGGTDNIFKGSLGLLGDYTTGKRMARDGKTELAGEDATDFALEWQVRDTEPHLFMESRAPQYPTKCIPPAKMMGNRLGSSHMRAQAEQVCASWKGDKDDCIFDVMATRDIEVAKEGAIKMA